MSDEDLVLKLPSRVPARRPRDWALLISVGALVLSIGSTLFSGMQWWEARRTRQTSELPDGPYLELRDVRIEPADCAGGCNAANTPIIGIVIGAIHNLGTKLALGSNIKYSIYTSETPSLLGSYKPVQTQAFNGSTFGNIGPNENRQFTIILINPHHLVPALTQKTHFQIRGKLFYDDSHKEGVNTSFCYDLVYPELNRPPSEIRPCIDADVEKMINEPMEPVDSPPGQSK